MFFQNFRQTRRNKIKKHKTYTWKRFGRPTLRIVFPFVVIMMHNISRQTLGTLAHWHIGTLAHWHIGTLAHWHIGTLAACYANISPHVSSHLAFLCPKPLAVVEIASELAMPEAPASLLPMHAEFPDWRVHDHWAGRKGMARRRRLHEGRIPMTAWHKSLEHCNGELAGEG